MDLLESQRLDKWLWAARFFKTRQLAADAVSGGKVHLNGQHTKPGKDISVGAKLLIRKDHYQWELEVVRLTKQRRPATEASLLYLETPESAAKRQETIAQQRIQQALAPQYPSHRPNKKERRLIHRFKQS